MALAQIGIFTSLGEALATAVGAGMVLGAFGAGAVGVLFGWPRQMVEGNAVTYGYYGGIVATIFALLDSILRYT